MAKVKFEKRNNEWICKSPNQEYLAVIEKKGLYYYAAMYSKENNLYVHKFNFPRQHKLEDMKALIRENAWMQEIPNQKQTVDKPVFSPKTSKVQEKYWWMDMD